MSNRPCWCSVPVHHVCPFQWFWSCLFLLRIHFSLIPPSKPFPLSLKFSSNSTSFTNDLPGTLMAQKPSYAFEECLAIIFFIFLILLKWSPGICVKKSSQLDLYVGQVCADACWCEVNRLFLSVYLSWVYGPGINIFLWWPWCFSMLDFIFDSTSDETGLCCWFKPTISSGDGGHSKATSCWKNNRL